MAAQSEKSLPWAADRRFLALRQSDLDPIFDDKLEMQEQAHDLISG